MVHTILLCLLTGGLAGCAVKPVVTCRIDSLSESVLCVNEETKVETYTRITDEAVSKFIVLPHEQQD